MTYGLKSTFGLILNIFEQLKKVSNPKYVFQDSRQL